MEAAALCVRLLMFEFILLGTGVQKSYSVYGDALCLRVHPNRLQHFEYDPVSFHCEGSDSSTQLRRVRSSEENNPECKNERTSTGFVCSITNIYVADSGEYWCEIKGGLRSKSVYINVTAGSVILDSPALPVSEGGAVTLSCKLKTPTTNLSPVFYKDDVQMESSSTGEVIINNVNKSHEGLYKCSIPGAGESPGSWLSVRDALSSDSGTSRTLNPGGIAIIILVLALVLLAVGFLYFRNHRALPSYQSVVSYFSSKIQTATSHSGQDDRMVPADEPADDQCSATYAVVVTNQRKNKVPGHEPADDQSSLTYAVVIPKQRKNKDAADNHLHAETNQRRKPRTDKDEKEAVYSTLKMVSNMETPDTGDT